MASKIINTKFKNTFNQKKEKFERLPQKGFYVISFFLNLSVIFLALLSRFVLPPEIPLYYGFPQNTQQLALSFMIFLPCLVSLVLSALNAYLSTFIDNGYLKKILAVSALLISILSSITTAKIIFLVGRI